MDSNTISKLREKSSCLTVYAAALITQLYSVCDENEKNTEQLEKLKAMVKNMNGIFDMEENI